MDVKRVVQFPRVQSGIFVGRGMVRERLELHFGISTNPPVQLLYVTAGVRRYRRQRARLERGAPPSERRRTSS